MNNHLADHQHNAVRLWYLNLLSLVTAYPGGSNMKQLSDARTQKNPQQIAAGPVFCFSSWFELRRRDYFSLTCRSADQKYQNKKNYLLHSVQTKRNLKKKVWNNEKKRIEPKIVTWKFFIQRKKFSSELILITFFLKQNKEKYINYKKI